MICDSPALVVFALGVRLQIIVALEPFGALDTKVLTESRQILWILARLVLCEMARRVDVGDNLVIVSVGSQYADLKFFSSKFTSGNFQNSRPLSSSP